MDIRECSYCYKVFTRHDNLNRHLTRCSIKKYKEKKNANKITKLEKYKNELIETVEKL